MKSKALFIALSIVLLSFMQVSGQTAVGYYTSTGKNTSIDKERTIKFENDSEAEEIILNIKEGSKKLQLSIRSTINAGNLNVEVYNPKDKKESHMALGTQTRSKKKETAKGNINIALMEPTPGHWKIKITPKKASGHIRISSSIIE